MELQTTKMCRITVITSLFNCAKYLEGYFEAVEGIENKQEIEILLIHNAPKEEELVIINKFLPRFPFIKHFVVEREGLYESWNRGITLASGKYVTIWNVDDVRLPNSLMDQADSLDIETNAALSFGNFVIVKEYGMKKGQLVSGPEYHTRSRAFSRQFHITCFPMWRKDIHSTIGYFDEQFKLIADFDFQIRVAEKYPMIKIDKELGFYLEGTSANLSTNLLLQDLEHTVLHWRYGNFDSLNLPYLFRAFKFKLFHLKWQGTFHKMRRWTFLDFWRYGTRFPMVFLSIVRLPRHIARIYFKRHFYRWFPKKKEDKLSTSAL